jgi:hypothetical protein
LSELHARRAELPELRGKVLASLERFPTWDECSRRMLEIYARIVRSA